MSSVRWHFGFPDSLCFARWICTALSALSASVYGREESRRSLPKRFMPLHSTVLLWDNLAQDGPSCKQGQDSKNDQQDKLSWPSSSFQVGRSCLHQSLCFSLRLLLAFQTQITTRQLACLQSCIQWMLEVGLVKRMSALMLTQTSWQPWFNLLEKEMQHAFKWDLLEAWKAIVKVLNPKPVEAWNECIYETTQIQMTFDFSSSSITTLRLPMSSRSRNRIFRRTSDQGFPIFHAKRDTQQKANMTKTTSRVLHRRKSNQQ